MPPLRYVQTEDKFAIPSRTGTLTDQEDVDAGSQPGSCVGPDGFSTGSNLAVIRPVGTC